jgi:RNA polymerase sigma factor for flagellar operon FliA
LYQDQRKASQEHLIHQYAPLVKRIAHHLMGRLPASVAIDDLIQSGMLGLLEAAKRYEPGRGATFETYVGIRIKGAMLDELRKGDWTPRSVHRSARLVSETMRQLENQLGRDPSDAEVAAAMGISQAEYYNTLKDARGTRLFHFTELSEDDNEYVFRHATDQADLSWGVERDALMASLVSAIENLPEREKLVLALYYTEQLNLKEIGEVLGVSESRVSQIHSQAALRLRSKMSSWTESEGN